MFTAGFYCPGANPKPRKWQCTGLSFPSPNSRGRVNPGKIVVKPMGLSAQPRAIFGNGRNNLYVHFNQVQQAIFEVNQKALALEAEGKKNATKQDEWVGLVDKTIMNFRWAVYSGIVLKLHRRGTDCAKQFFSLSLHTRLDEHSGSDISDETHKIANISVARPRHCISLMKIAEKQ